MVLGDFGIEAEHFRTRTQEGGAVPEAAEAGPKYWSDRLLVESPVQFSTRDENAQRLTLRDSESQL